MNARGRRAYFGNRPELGAGSRPAVHERIEHTRSGGLADGGRDPSGGEVALVLDIHTFITHEVYMFRML